MLEAVNSTLQSAPFVRASAEQVSSTESFTANPDRTQKIAVAPYISPHIYMDVNYNKAVLQIRDSDTGDVLHQFPTETNLEASARQTARQEQAAQPQAPAQSSPKKESDSAQADVQAIEGRQPTPTAAPQQQVASAPHAQQIAAFQAAARAGNSNAGSVTLFA